MVVSSAAAQPRPTEGPTKLATDFFNRLRTSDARTAVTQLFAGSEMTTLNPGDINLVVSQTETVLKVYGKPGAPEFVREDVLSPSVLKQSYVLPADRAPTFWRFYFYKRGQAWTLNRIEFDDKIQDAFPKLAPAPQP